MNKLYERCLVVLLVLYVVAMLIRVMRLTFPYGAILLAIGISYLVVLSLSVQRKRAEKGYWASNSNQQAHDVFYHEGKRQLQFYGSLDADEYILHVPSDTWWREHMPDWAKDRRDIIIERLVEELESEKFKKFEVETRDSLFKPPDWKSFHAPT